MSARSFPIEIITPERTVFRGDAESLIVPAYEGYLGIQRGHQDLVALLRPGPVWFRLQEARRWFAIGGGFLEVHGGTVRLLVRTAEAAEEIDLERARRAFARARERLRSADPSVDRERAQRALERAQARILAGEKKVFREL